MLEQGLSATALFHHISFHKLEGLVRVSWDPTREDLNLDVLIDLKASLRRMADLNLFLSNDLQRNT